MLPEAQLAIFIKGKYTRQGKFCYIDTKPCFIANMDEVKWFRNFSGYAIAKQILDKLPRGTKIIYKRSDLNQHYITNKSKFYKKGVAVNYGNHQQIVLPIKQWKWVSGKPKEKYDLPTMCLSEWKKEQPVIEDYSMPSNVFKKAYMMAFKS